MGMPELNTLICGAPGLLLPLEALGEQQRPLAGGKAINLGAMLRDRLPVPRGYCLTTRAFELWLQSCPEAMDWLNRLQETKRDDLETVRGVSANLRKILAPVPVPAAVSGAIRMATQQVQAAEYAVRSSATLEDLPAASLAGQHDTVLGVQGDEAVVAAVRRCWLSLFSERAMLYRARANLNRGRVQMAVIIQAMIRPEIAGVLFTADPLSGDLDRMVVEAAQGTGERLVSGLAAPERVVLDKQTRQPVTPRPPLLEAGLVQRLAEAAHTIETLFGGPQDIEWAARNGEVWFLQARPITVLGRAVAEPGSIWTRANVCENLPGVLTPMSWSVLEVLLIGSFKPIFRYLGTDTDAFPWVKRINGRAYLNVALSEKLLRGLCVSGPVTVHELMGGLDAHRAAQGLRGASLAQGAARGRRAPRLGSWRSLGSQLLFMTLVFAAGAADLCCDGRGAFLRRLASRVKRLRATALSEIPDDRLLDQVLQSGALLFPELQSRVATARVAALVVLGIACSLGWTLLARRWGDVQGVTAGSPCCAVDMASANPARELAALADWVRCRGNLAALVLAPRKWAELCQALSEHQDGPHFLSRWDEYMARHGHHARGEMDLSNARWSEMPDYVLEQLRSRLTREAGAGPKVTQPDAKRGNARSSFRRWILTRLAKQARDGAAYRENIKSEAIKAVAFYRSVILEAGMRLVRRGHLAERDDVFFLTVEEVAALLKGGAPSDVGGTVAERKAQHARYEDLPEPLLVFGDDFSEPVVPDGSNVKSSPQGTHLTGLPISAGVASGMARVILHADKDATLLPGEVLVAPYTDPGWTPYFLNAAAIVVDLGGQLSHGSIVARELGIPAVANVVHGTRLIRSGQWVEVNGNLGVVTVRAVRDG